MVRFRRYVARARRWLPTHAAHHSPWRDLVTHINDAILEGATGLWKKHTDILRKQCIAWKRQEVSDGQLQQALTVFLSNTKLEVRRSTRRDRSTFIQNLTTDARQYSIEGDYHREWRAVNTIMNFGGKKGMLQKSRFLVGKNGPVEDEQQ